MWHEAKAEAGEVGEEWVEVGEEQVEVGEEWLGVEGEVVGLWGRWSTSCKGAIILRGSVYQ